MPADLDRADAFEPEAFVKGYVSGVSGIQISRDSVPVAGGQPVFHERRTKSAASDEWVDGNEREKPVRLLRTAVAHRRINLEEFGPCRRIDAAFDQVVDRFAVRMCVRRDPEGCVHPVNDMSTAMIERRPALKADEFRGEREMLFRIRIEAAADRIVGKAEGHHTGNTACLWVRGRAHSRSICLSHLSSSRRLASALQKLREPYRERIAKSRHSPAKT